MKFLIEKNTELSVIGMCGQKGYELTYDQQSLISKRLETWIILWSYQNKTSRGLSRGTPRRPDQSNLKESNHLWSEMIPRYRDVLLKSYTYT